MPQAKKKQVAKTRKKTVSRAASSKNSRRTAKSAKASPQEKWHVYIMTALSMVAAILLCADAAIFAVL